MSRTYKDRPSKVANPDYFIRDEERYYIIEYDAEYTCYYTKETKTCKRKLWLQKAGVKTKKPKHKDCEWHWMSTPSWWTRMFMNRPQRFQGRQWEKRIVREDLAKVVNDYFDTPSVSRKPHMYFW